MLLHCEFMIVISSGNHFTTLLSLETRALFKIEINDGMN